MNTPIKEPHGISITDSDNVVNLHIPDRLEVNLLKADGDVEIMELIVYFKIKIILPNGRVVGEPLLDYDKPLRLNCKGNAALTEAMKVIQQAIGQGRYEQATAPIPESIESPGISLSTEET